MGATAEEINVSQSLCVRDGPIKPDTDTLTLKCTKKKKAKYLHPKMHSQELDNQQCIAMVYRAGKQFLFHEVFNLYFLFNDSEYPSGNA